MTQEGYLEQIFRHYRLVTALSTRNEGKVLRLRNRTVEKDLVLRLFSTPVPSYGKLCDIRCENLPEIYDSVLLEDGQAVLEEYVPGISLAQQLEVERYSYPQAKQVLIGLCNALTVLHERKIVHRDIKPENIILGDDGRVVLIDLNISRTVSEAKKDTMIMGTVGYASPEQLGITQSDGRTDIYAAGILLNVMLTGKHPSEEVAPGRAGRIIRKCTAINPAQRYPTAKKLAKAL